MEKQVNDSNINDIVDLLNEGCCIFIGAGVSNNLGFPLWKELANELVRFLWQKKDDLVVEKINDSLIDELGDFIDKDRLIDVITYCKKQFEKNNLIEEYEEKIKRIFNDDNKYKKLKDNDIYAELFSIAGKSFFVQTNIDKSLNRYYGGINSFLNFSLPDSNNLDNLEKPFLVYLHGIVDDSSSWIFTEDEYIEFYHENEKFKNFLMVLFKKYNIIFLGYRLEDKEIFHYIAETIKEDKTRIFITEETHKKIYQNIIRESGLNSYNITMLTYLGEDGYGQGLLNLLKKINDLRKKDTSLEPPPDEKRRFTYEQ